MSYTPRIGRTFYISSTGNDSHDGLSPATAWLTISKVNTSTKLAGDSFLFEGGKTFIGFLDLANLPSTSKNPIRIGSYGLGKAKIQANNTGGVSFKNSSGIILENLIIEGINQVARNYGVYYGTDATATGHANNFLALNLEVFGFITGIGILTYSAHPTFGVTNSLIMFCDVYRNGDGMIIAGNYEGASPVLNSDNQVVRFCRAYENEGDPGMTTSNTGSGIYMYGCTNSLIEYCEAFNNGRKNAWTSGGPFGIWIFDSDNCIIQKCESHHNQTGTGAAAYDGGGFDIDGGATNCIIQHCYSHDNEGYGYLMYNYGSPRGFSGNKVRYNISINDGKAHQTNAAFGIGSVSGTCTDNAFYNNLIYIDSSTRLDTTKTSKAIAFLGGTFTTLDLRNNIYIIDGPDAVMASGTALGTSTTNIYYGLGGANVNFSTGGTITNPYINKIPNPAPTLNIYPHGRVDSALEEFKLQPISPAINAGSVVANTPLPARDFWGNPTPNGTVNIGPHEL